MVYQPSALREFLTSIGRCPKKSLSQNFLIDGNIIRKIVKCAAVADGDTVLEIGSGPGALTDALLEAGASVIAVERDEVLAEALKRFANSNRPTLNVCSDDIIAFLDSGKIHNFKNSDQKLKVVANLPYHLTTAIIERLIQMPEHFSSLTLMVQEEVARRLTGSPGTKAYGSLTVFLRFYSHPHYAFGVSRHCFYPAPKVDSAIVHIELRPTPDVSDPEAFFNMTQTAFQQRRKMLRGSLKQLWTSEQITEALKKCHLADTARPEELSLEQFLHLFEALNE